MNSGAVKPQNNRVKMVHDQKKNLKYHKILYYLKISNAIFAYIFKLKKQLILVY